MAFLSAVSQSRCRCGSVRGWPVLSSHFFPGLAPQTGQRTAKACFSVVFIATDCASDSHKSGQFRTHWIQQHGVKHYRPGVRFLRDFGIRDRMKTSSLNIKPQKTQGLAAHTGVSWPPQCCAQRANPQSQMSGAKAKNRKRVKL